LTCAVIATATKRWSLIDAAKAQFDAAKVRHTATLVSTAFVTLLLLNPALYAQECFNAATAPVRDTVGGVAEYFGSVLNASEEHVLNQRKADLDRRAERLAREYAEYNESVERYYWNKATRQTESYLPEKPNFTPQLPPATQQFVPPQNYAIPPQTFQQLPNSSGNNWPNTAFPNGVPFDAPALSQPVQANLIPRERSLIVVPQQAYGNPYYPQQYGR
jgi:hypothetical protein